MKLLGYNITKQLPRLPVVKKTIINTINPHSYCLFVGMTAPKQEKWVQEQHNNLDTSIICSIGAVFDFYADTVKRPSKFWIKLGLEWLPRFLKEPKRLAKRNLISTPKFIADVLSQKYLKNKNHKQQIYTDL